MKDCLFCKIANGLDLVWEDREYAAFNDIHPKAKTHLLVCPKEHHNDLDEFPLEKYMGFMEAIKDVAKEQGISGAYRVQINVGREGGQEIDHLHAHVLSSR